MRPERVSAVLIDMDGTLIDSESIKSAYLVDMMRSHGAVLEYDEFDSIIGSDLDTLLVAMQRILDRSGIAGDPLDLLKTMPETRIDAYLDPRCAPIAGAVAFLDDLRSHGVKCALVSSTPAYAVLVALNRFDLISRFDAIVSGDMVAAQKPDPRCYELAMSLLGVDPAECVVVEDSASGIASGRAAGAYVCAFDNGSGAMDFSGAHERFSSFDELRFR